MTTQQSQASPGAPGPEQIIEAARFRPPSGGPDLPSVRIPWLLGGVLVVLAVTIWAAWFVLTARSVAITTDPADASIFVEAWPAPRVGNHWLLRPGRQAVRVEAPGYITFSGDIEVSEAALQTQHVTLDPLPGHLRVTVSPDVIARITVDGEARGMVPGDVRDIPAGARTIVLSAERYRDYTLEIEIEGKGIEQTLDAVLEPAWADIAVDSSPDGATVLVDGNDRGTTPLSLELLEGRRVVQLRKDGYKSWRQTLNVVAGSTVNLGEVDLAPADGRLSIASTPPGANVTVDGEFQGRTPLELAVAPGDEHEVRLTKEGFVPAKRSAAVKSGERSSLNVELEAELATIHFVTAPEQAELLIDGEPAGSATQTVRLPTRAHEITVRSPGYATYRTTITPRKGVEKRFRIRLKTAQEVAAGGTPRAAPRKGFITTHAGQEMKLFRGGRVLMGSPRRDGARRANEIQREVVLARPFYLSVKEVTNGEFRQFLANHVSKPFNGNDLDKDELPVSGVAWSTAATYCNWMSRRDGLPPFYQIRFGEVLGVNPDATGYRLPTEAEWEWAARVPPKGEATRFPWGNKFPPRGRSGNYADTSAARVMGNTLSAYTDGFAVAAPVGSFQPNLHGLYDMGGNVAEWVHDIYDAAPPASPTTDPLGPAAGAQRVIKGAGWAHGTETELRVAYRDAGTEGRDDVGFRIARYAN